MYIPCEIMLIYLFPLIGCEFSPIDDKVEIGTVLLPATRRGKYLANIIRRQAIDGTKIKFNQDADQINADSRVDPDFLSDRLLPHIISEQDRRLSVYKRVMAAILNAINGVTIVEFRSRPPLIIKRGLYFRCPFNSSTVEPDRSGILRCQGNKHPLQIPTDSCMISEDAVLYTNSYDYFFCNRPPLDKEIKSTVIEKPCKMSERTPYNYTLNSCTLELTGDVVMNLRYYPDKSYQKVEELDPNYEVCSTFYPCQVGYVFSIPDPCTAVTLPDDSMPKNLGDEYDALELPVEFGEDPDYLVDLKATIDDRFTTKASDTRQARMRQGDDVIDYGDDDDEDDDELNETEIFVETPPTTTGRKVKKSRKGDWRTSLESDKTDKKINKKMLKVDYRQFMHTTVTMYANQTQRYIKLTQKYTKHAAESAKKTRAVAQAPKNSKLSAPFENKLNIMKNKLTNVSSTQTERKVMAAKRATIPSHRLSTAPITDEEYFSVYEDDILVFTTQRPNKLTITHDSATDELNEVDFTISDELE